MCTTYTWLTYGLPDRRHQGARPAVPAQPAATMAGIREEEEEAVEEAGCPRRHPYAPAGSLRSLRPRRARHWMGLAIVGVQMAAWCLVGALLMHRGVTTLKRRDAALVRDSYTAAPPATSTTLPGWTIQNDVLAESSPTSELQPPASSPAPSASPAPTPTPGQDDDEDYEEMSWNDMMKKWSSFVPVRPAPGLHAARAEDADDAGLGEGSPFGPAAGQPAAPGGLPGIGRVGTGAATAVVMVTVGGVMLVVGPAFMFIKIMDVYQRQKRLSKLSQHDDPPPSYDEVAEKAPRYSALFQVLENGELTPLALPAEGCGASAAPGSASTSTSGPPSGSTGEAPAVVSVVAESTAAEAAPETVSTAGPRVLSREASAPAATTPRDAEPAAAEARRPSRTAVPSPAAADAAAPPADEDADAEADARTPLRPKKEKADAGAEDKSRRRSV